MKFILCLLILSCCFANDDTFSVILNGFNPNGSTKQGTFGIAEKEKLIVKAAKVLGVPDGFDDPYAKNQIVQVAYYGDTPPKYYTEEDIKEIEAAGKGTPRYALIAAKFIKRRLELTKASGVNLGGGSYGALIGRYLIENNLENLAAEGKIKKWLTLEGVVCGAWAAGLAADEDIRKFVEEVLELDISDPKTMHHQWVNENIHNPHTATDCEYFKDILIGHYISSNDKLNEQLLTLATNRPNDGVLLVDDMYLHDVAPQSRFRGRMPAKVIGNTTHLSASKDDIFLQNIVSFVRGTRRVTIKLLQGKASQFDEDEYWYGDAEVVFQAKVFSPYIKEKWNVEKEIALVNRENHTAKVIKFGKNRNSKAIESTLFDWFVNPEEKSLKLELWAEEVDWDDMYKIEEDIMNPYEDLGKTQIEIPLDFRGKKLFQAKSEKWGVSIVVEIDDYASSK
ncbi:hypothetical protein [Candidatus Uabimicrobium amorphum]|uniref:Uncharacterized protein n=1 Tax=Uabimicrobium amorphum TaxID=2596890 RepID=A0A5S9IN10_UABAM|nr:hypothetical protein [Candidatus Uabimicrobium amorphum]BBM84714.1 hypothetical protein UABAM_03075 [Candidatus Uabimicrobium amorphum]